jgi:hypothetical protein
MNAGIVGLVFSFVSLNAFATVDCLVRVSENEYGFNPFVACRVLQKSDSDFDDLTKMGNVWIAKFDPTEKSKSTQEFRTLQKEAAGLAAAVDILEKINNDFRSVQSLLRSPGGWKVCPAEVFRECTVIALSISDSDPAGRMLDGKPQPPAFRYGKAQDQLELLTAFASKATGNTDSKTVSWLNSLKSRVEEYPLVLPQLESNRKKLNALLSEKIRPAAQALVEELAPTQIEKPK